MKLSYFLSAFICLVFFQDALAAERGVQKRGSDACNEYFDNLLNDLKADKEYFEEPYVVKEKSLVIAKKVLFINYTGEAEIHEAYISGMSTLHRDGDVIVNKKKDSTVLKVFLGAGVLSASCDATLRLMGHGPRVKVEAQVSYISMRVDVNVDQKTGKNPKIVNFDIEEVKGSKVKVSGLGPLSFIANAFIGFMGIFFKNMVHLGVETQLKRFLADKVKNYTVPKECLQDGF